MEIVHFAPFAPSSAGIYEAARDMVRADVMRGHSVSFVDTGPVSKGKQAAAKVGEVDDRGGFAIVTSSPSCANDADLLVLHTGVYDNWIVKCQAPMLVVIHGRPLATFRLEQNNPTLVSYGLIAELAKWPRVKKMVSFWPEFDAYWKTLVPNQKLVSLEWPPIDIERFSNSGDVYQIPPEARGKINALICDSWREDVDAYEIVSGAIEAARTIPGLRVHIFGVESPEGTNTVPPCWEHLLAELRRLGALGVVFGRMLNFERVYRAMDFVMTPHRIVTRVIGEALSVGIPVLAASGCEATPWTACIQEPESIARETQNLVRALLRDRGALKKDCLHMAQKFSLKAYGEAIEPIYREAVA